MPTAAGDERHQKRGVDVIHTGGFLRRSFRAALIIIRRFTVVYYEFFNLHKSLNDGDDPEVHFRILKGTKNIYFSVGPTLATIISAISHVNKAVASNTFHALIFAISLFL